MGKNIKLVERTTSQQHQQPLLEGELYHRKTL
jgi:hypothetical protein